ncbi:MAG: oligosaccharide repeat unit polymerase [Symploca sp. SIO2E9]|nr:oligosaccharide repeat unit polymerase [Symploca sp. SIO2E9]
MSFPTIFIFSYFVLIYLQALNIYLNKIYEFSFLIATWLVPYIFVLTAAAWLFLMNHGPRKNRSSFFKHRVSTREEKIVKLTPFISTLLVILPIIYLIDKGIEGTAFFFLISNPGEIQEALKLRIGGLVSNYSPVMTVIYSYSRSLFYPIYIAIMVALRVNGLISKTHLSAVLAVAALYSVFTAAKAPLATLLITGLISAYFSKRSRILSIRFLSLAFLGLFLPALLYPLWFGSESQDTLFVAASNLWRRLTLVPSQASAVYFEAFTNTYPHLGFSSNRWLATIFGVDYNPTPSLIYKDYLQGSVEGGLVNASYFASFYADWGILGVVFGTGMVALILASLQIFFDRSNADALTTGIRAVALVATVQLMLTNFYSVCLGRGLISSSILLIIINFFFKKSKSRFI